MHRPPAHRNRLLAAIPHRSRKRLLSNATEVELPPSTVLHEPQSRPEHAFFLTSGLASVLAVTTEGVAAEVGAVGREGFTGSLHLIGPVDAPTHCRMQLKGAAVRIPFDHLQAAFEEDDHLHRSVLELVQAQTHHLSQLAGCHRTHSAPQRLTRWLLTAQKFTGSAQIDITQEVLSELLGTRRVTIAAAAGTLQRQKLIEYTRGHLRILNRKGLEAITCECYATLKSLHTGLYH